MIVVSALMIGLPGVIGMQVTELGTPVRRIPGGICQDSACLAENMESIYM